MINAEGIKIRAERKAFKNYQTILQQSCSSEYTVYILHLLLKTEVKVEKK